MSSYHGSQVQVVRVSQPRGAEDVGWRLSLVRCLTSLGRGRRFWCPTSLSKLIILLALRLHLPHSTQFSQFLHSFQHRIPHFKLNPCICQRVFRDIPPANPQTRTPSTFLWPHEPSLRLGHVDAENIVGAESMKAKVAGVVSRELEGVRSKVEEEIRI